MGEIFDRNDCRQAEMRAKKALRQEETMKAGKKRGSNWKWCRSEKGEGWGAECVEGNVKGSGEVRGLRVP